MGEWLSAQPSVWLYVWHTLILGVRLHGLMYGRVHKIPNTVSSSVVKPVSAIERLTFPSDTGQVSTSILWNNSEPHPPETRLSTPSVLWIYVRDCTVRVHGGGYDGRLRWSDYRYHQSGPRRCMCLFTVKIDRSPCKPHQSRAKWSEILTTHLTVYMSTPTGIITKSLSVQ